MLEYIQKENRLITLKDQANNNQISSSKDNKKTIVIFGASGGTGLQLIEHLIQHSNYNVIAAVRNPSSLDKYKNKILIDKINLSDADTIEEAVKDADVIVSSLGNGGFIESMRPTYLYSSSAKIILNAMKKFNKKRVLFITSSGVEYDDRASVLYKNIFRPLLMNTYMDMIKLETIVELSDDSIEWTLIRPSRLIDENISKNIYAFNRIIEKGNYEISRADLAKFIIHEIENNVWIRKYPALTYSN